MTQIISTLDEVSHQYDAAFVDLWGCVHDGERAFPEAVSALQRFRAAGKTAILVTNSPRPWDDVKAQITAMGVPEDAYDAIASSGDSARAAMYRGIVGEKVWHIGGPEESSFFEPLSVIDDPADIRRVDLDEAEGIVCTGPENPLADPAVYRPQFLYAKQKGLKLLCANPDIVVDRGEVREWCAGALAALYTEMGGESLYFGKPHPPIYDLARRHMNALGRPADDARIVAIGDGIGTDIAGALGEGIDAVFITGGLARDETMTDGAPDPDRLKTFLDSHQTVTAYAIAALR